MNDLGYPKLMRDMTIGLILAAIGGLCVIGGINAFDRVNHAYEIART